MLLFILCCMVSLIATGEAHDQASNAVEIDKGLLFLRDPSKNILLSQDRWILAIDINITNYYDIINHFMTTIDKIGQIDLKIIHKALDNETKEIKYIIQKEISAMISDLIKIRTQLDNIYFTLAPIKGRSSRSLCDICGTGLHLLFGVLTTRDLEAIQVQLDGVESRQQGIVHLLDSQVSFINESVRAGNRNTIDIKKLSSTLANLNSKIKMFQSKVQSQLDDLGPAISALFSIDAELRNFRHLLDIVRTDVDNFQAALELTALKRLSPYFLDPSRLLKVLHSVQPSLAHDLAFFTRMDLSDMFMYYELAKVSAAAFQNKIRLFVEIPLQANNRMFELYQAKPFPILLHNHSIAAYINPNFNYLAISTDRQLYMELNAVDLEPCENGLIKICPPLKAVYKATRKSCLFGLFTGDVQATGLCSKVISLNFQETFIRALDSETWFYSVHKSKLLIQCPSINNTARTDLQEIILQGAGSITLNQNCIAQGENFILFPHSSKSSIYSRHVEFQVPKVPGIVSEVKGSKAIQQPSSDQIEIVLQKIIQADNPPLTLPLADWHRQLDQLIAVPWYHSNIHRAYSISSTFILIVLIIILYWQRKVVVSFLCKRRTSANKTKGSNQGEGEESIPLKQIATDNQMLKQPGLEEEGAASKHYASGIY